MHFTLTVPSQVIVSRTLAKKQMMMSVATKVAIQLNCKLGGEVWTLEIPVGGVHLTYILAFARGQKLTTAYTTGVRLGSKTRSCKE